ncbi:hypothetical protein Tco_0271517 [Tanacetum coccineum]
MSALKFADSHNMVAFLAKPTESEGFEQIVDFLNANPIKYALTVNPTIYTSCIEQFWATAKVKTVNGEVQLQALVDGKKVIITETSVRRDLQLEDTKGIECLPNADIFVQLALIGYKKPSQQLTFYKAFFSPQWKFFIHTILQCLSAKSIAWNEFSSTMASAIVCLATNQKFNFSKFIFERMMKNVDSSVKFLMYPRFVQVFLDKQIGDMSTHDEIFVTPSHTKKVYSNMKRVGKGFSGAVTPLFPTMMVQAQKDIDEAIHEERGDNVERAATAVQDSGNIIKTQSTAIPNVPLPQGIGSGGRPRRQETMGDIPAQTRFKSLSKQSNDPPLSRVNTLGSGEDRLKLKELMDLCTKLSDRVLDLETTKTTQAKEIASLKKRVTKLERKRKSKTLRMKRLFKVGRSAQVVSSEDKEVTLVDETQGWYDDAQMFDTYVFNDEEVFVAEQSEKVVEKVVSNAKVSTAATITTEEITLAQALAELRSEKPKVVDKGKAKMIKPEKPFKKTEQIRLDEELTFKLQAEEEEQARLAREKAEKV